MALGNLGFYMPTPGGSASADAWGSSSDTWEGGNQPFDWGANITQWMKLAPNIIASAKGNPYASGQYGQGSYPTAGGVQGGGQGVYGGGSFLGASGFGQISGTTLLLIGLGVVLLMRRR